MKRCFIFAAGTFYGLRRKPEEPEDLVIAADAGYRTCRELGIVPDLLLGDFDSMEQPEDFANIHRSPVEKDDTDTMLGGQDRAGAGLRRVLPLRRHWRTAAGPYSGQSPNAAVPAAAGRPGLSLRQ